MMNNNEDEVDGAMQYCRHFVTLCTEIENEGENLDEKLINKCIEQRTRHVVVTRH